MSRAAHRQKRPKSPGRVRRRVRQVLGWYRYIPTSLTLGNSLCGFGAILYTLHIYDTNTEMAARTIFATSAWLVVGAMIFDMLDGWSARLLNAYSDHGMQMDSLADMVTFGVAPAVIVAVMAHSSEISWLPYRVVWVLAAIYLGCAALRLALYNVMAAEEKAAADRLAHGIVDRGPADESSPEIADLGAILNADDTQFATEAEAENRSHAFHGLPSPGAAAAVCSVVILLSVNEPNNGPYGYIYEVLAQLMPIYAAILGFLMVSPIPYMHFGRWLGSKRGNKLKILVLIAFAVAFAREPQLTAAVIINAYILSGPIKALFAWLRERSVPGPAGRAA